MDEISRLKGLISEAKVYTQYRQDLNRAIHELHRAYQHRHIDYLTFKAKLDRLLQGKTRKEALALYDTYIATLYEEISEYAAELFYRVYNDQGFALQKERLLKLKVEKSLTPPIIGPEPVHTQQPEVEVQVETVSVKVTKSRVAEPAPQEPEFEEMPQLPVKSSGEGLIDDEKSVSKPSLSEPIGFWAKVKIFFRDAAARLVSWVPTKKEKPAAWVKTDKSKPDKASERLVADAKEAENPETAPFFTFSFIKTLFKKPVTAKTTELEPTMERIRKLKEYKPFQDEESDVPDTLLRQEAHRIKGLMKQRQRLRIYEPSSLGAIANMTVRRTSLFLIENFPHLFKSLYNSLRAANIKILSNTYVNIIVLCVLCGFAAFTTLFTAFFTITQKSFFIGLGRGIVAGLVSSLVIFYLFYYYPTMKIKQRRRMINTNLPFAVNHMAAVAGSGVTPVAMFRLIAEAKEYEEISIEVEKIVIYVDLYGYDILTAIKSVSATGPSQELTEFFDGYVATVESGGDLKNYLNQKADEALLNYKLERQKYLETISTYTDMYTGILIASPLFFVVALTLVNMLGGTIGNMSVSSIMVYGTYLVLPLLNVMFLLFLESTQPEA